MKELIGDPYECFGIIIFCMIGFLCILWGVYDKEKRRIKKQVHDKTVWQIRMLNERKHMSTLL